MSPLHTASVQRAALQLCAAWLLCLAAPRLLATDELLAWDDFESYAPGSITTTSGSPFAGGDGWATSGGEVGWEVAALTGTSPAPTAAIVSPGLVAGSNICLNTAGTAILKRVLLPLTPTAAQPLWISFLMQANLAQQVAEAGVPPTNFIHFDYLAWGGTAFSINTTGTRVDGSTTATQPIRWRLDNQNDSPSTILEVDSNIHLVVLELTTSQLSLWIFPTATPDPTTIATTPAMTTESLSGALPFDRISFQVNIKPPPTPYDAVLGVDDLAIGSSEAAVTASGMPHVAGLAPATGVVTGGDTLALTGTGFDASSQVTVGGNAATAVAPAGGTAISCLTPASTSGQGTVDVVVSNHVGSALHPQSFTYQAASAADPSNTAPPTIDDSAGTGPGSAWVGASGSWSPTPAAFTYAWQSSPDGSFADATPIGGATSATYSVTTGDLGNWLRIAVTPTGTSHVAYSAFVQVAIPKGTSTSSTSTTATSASTTTSGTAASYAASVTSGTAGSSCGIGAGAGILLPALAWLALRRRSGGSAQRR
jgi:hypothetical protein